MPITGIVGLKPGYENAMSTMSERNTLGPHLQCQFMLMKDKGTPNQKIEPDDKAHIFRPKTYKSRKIEDIEDKNVYPSEGLLIIPKNCIGMIMFGLQYEFTNEKELTNSLKTFDINELPTGIAHGAAHLSEIIAPQFFTFGVSLSGNLLKDVIESRYDHLYGSININLTENDKGLTIESIELKESLYNIKSIKARYVEQLAKAYIES